MAAQLASEVGPKLPRPLEPGGVRARVLGVSREITTSLKFVEQSLEVRRASSGQIARCAEALHELTQTVPHEQAALSGIAACPELLGGAPLALETLESGA
jgi:hypothetical protein